MAAEIVALDEMVGAYFGEYADPERGITFNRFCHLLSNCRMFTTGFDHSHALEVFNKAAGGTENADALDSHGLRRALQTMANIRYESLRRQHWEKLEKLMNEMSLRREVSFDSATIGEMHGLLYDVELIPVAYRYIGPIRTLFTHYATSSGGYPDPSATWESLARQDVKDPLAINGRSAYRLCRATQLVPCCAVPRELLDLAASFQAVGDKQASDRRHYFEDEKMIAGDQQDWNYSARGRLEGEPRYNFPELIELLVTIALCMPPRVHRDALAEREKRIIDVFDKHLGMATPESFESTSPALDPEVAEATQTADSPSHVFSTDRKARRQMTRGLTFTYRQRRGGIEKLDMHGIFAKLKEVLPALPEAQEWKAPTPAPPAAHWSSVVQPPRVEEVLAAKKEFDAKKAAVERKMQDRFGHFRTYGRRVSNQRYQYLQPAVDWNEKRQKMLGELLEHGDVPSLNTPKLDASEFMTKTTKKNKKGQELIKKQAKAWTGLESVPLKKVCFYAKRPAPPEPEVPPQFCRERRCDQLALMEAQIEEQSRKARHLAGPATGWVLRMTLIAEPLLAPHCTESEEVSTLIETALTSRRLRNYDVAIVLLMRARTLWARFAAGQEVPTAWAEVQPLTITQSPWELPEAGAGRAQSQSAGVGTWEVTGAPDVLCSSPVPEDAEGLDQTILPLDLKRDAAQSPTLLAGVQMRARPSSDVGGRPESSATPDDVAPLDLSRVRPPEGPRPASARPAGGASSACSPGLTEERRYDVALDFAQACGESDDNIRHLKNEVNIFFLCELASLHSAIQEDDKAAQLYWRAHSHSEQLPDNHPDKAVVWCGFGRVAFHAKQFDLAARSFARARRIRERTIGEDTVETATTYSNLACCLVELKRPLEACAYLELASEILKVLVGEDHPRAQTTLRNLEKVKTLDKHLHCEVPPLFGIPVQDLNRISRSHSRRRRKKRSAKGKGSTTKSRLTMSASPRRRRNSRSASPRSSRSPQGRSGRRSPR
mmetsp:Transcript_117281/g.203763  ORF Transcript_117281/g.203763 Transcript_117281/m.203763 type:complete len:1001 (-) Transcript_117281:18-3020(-)